MTALASPDHPAGQEQTSAGGVDELRDLLVRPVGGHHSFESCVELLGTSIRLGIHPPGGMLPPERELARQMGVSRATLREAIAAMRAAGLVTTRRGRGGGTLVTFSPTRPRGGARARQALARRAEELRDSLVFRRLVEPGAAYLAADRELGEEQRGLLIDAYDAVSTATAPGARRQADSRFHLAVAALTHSPSVIGAVTAVQADLHDMLGAIPVLEVNMSHSDAQHAEIFTAVLGAQPARARAVMEQHCDDTAALLHGLLTSGPASP